jgi:hypothetical protein
MIYVKLITEYFYRKNYTKISLKTNGLGVFVV